MGFLEEASIKIEFPVEMQAKIAWLFLLWSVLLLSPRRVTFGVAVFQPDFPSLQSILCIVTSLGSFDPSCLPA